MLERIEPGIVDRLVLWVIPFILMGSAARLGDLMFRKGAGPPSDPEQLVHWRRARRWLLFSEISALPAFIGLAIVVPRYFAWNSDFQALFSLGLGVFGYPTVIAVAKRFIDSKLEAAAGIPPEAPNAG